MQQPHTRYTLKHQEFDAEAEKILQIHILECSVPQNLYYMAFMNAAVWLCVVCAYFRAFFFSVCRQSDIAYLKIVPWLAFIYCLECVFFNATAFILSWQWFMVCWAHINRGQTATLNNILQWCHDIEGNKFLWPGRRHICFNEMRCNDCK